MDGIVFKTPEEIVTNHMEGDKIDGYVKISLKELLETDYDSFQKLVSDKLLENEGCLLNPWARIVSTGEDPNTVIFKVTGYVSFLSEVERMIDAELPI